MKVRNRKNPDKVIDVDGIHYDNVLKHQGWEPVVEEAPKETPKKVAKKKSAPKKKDIESSYYKPPAK